VSAGSRILKAEPVVRGGDVLGEGPTWVSSARRLMWTDILQNRLYSLAPEAAAPLRHDLAFYVACLGETERGSVIAATGLGWLLFDRGLAQFEQVGAPPFDAAAVRFNDGKVGPDGAFWVGTMDLNAREPVAALYRMTLLRRGEADEPAGAPGWASEVRVAARGLTISNGIGWSADGATMYLTDSKDGVIYRYRLEATTGAISDSRVLVHNPEEAGVPDGLAVDREGNLWSARWGGAVVICYDPQGQERARIDLPAAQPSSCCFGGENLDVLYITTARYGLRDPGELDGALFACACGARGQEPYRLAMTGGGS
jgi:sugar lactone lactonase YvrE